MCHRPRTLVLLVSSWLAVTAAATSTSGCGDEAGQKLSQIDVPPPIDLCAAVTPCDDEGATRCEGALVTTCKELAPGCLGWGDAAACPPNEACADDACRDACPDAGCGVAEALRCSPSAAAIVERCADGDGDGCLEWLTAETCPAVCSQAACADACRDECDASAARCEDGGVVTCADHDGDGCLEWGGRSACPAGACVLGACSDACIDECGEVGLTRCDGAAVATCELGASGCRQWGEPAVCPGGTTCSLGACDARCLDECVAGATSCEAGGVVTCGMHDADACLDRALPAACPSGEVCSAGGCAATCSDECPGAGARACDELARAVRECRQADADPCLEWVVVQTCSLAAGELCAGGTCASECVDECVAGDTRCALASATRVERCAERDGCLAWVEADDCAASGQLCAGGVCAATCSDECDAAACDGAMVVPCGELDGDPCRDRGAAAVCAPGLACVDGACAPSTTAPPLKIAEVLYQSEGPDDDVFIELGGPPGTPLAGFALVAINGADGAEIDRYPLGGGVLDASGRWVLAHPNAEPAIADFADATSPFADLQNGPDSLVLVYGDRVVDALGYGDFGADDVFRGEGDAAPATGNGVSLARRGELVDSDDNAADFAATLEPTPGRGYASAVRPRAHGDLIVSELMIDPEARSDATGEWIELYNPSADTTFELAGCTLESDPEEVHVVARSLMIGPRGRVVVARSDEALAFATPDYVYDGLTLANDGDAFALLCDDEFIDLVTWGDAPGGASWSLDPDATDAVANDDDASWCAAPLVAADAGTPGDPNPPCPDQSGTYDVTALDSEWGSCDPDGDWQFIAFEGAPPAEGDATLELEWWAVLCELYADTSTLEVEVRVGPNWLPIGDTAFFDESDACQWLAESWTVDAALIDVARAGNGRIELRFRIDGGCPAGVGCGFLGLTQPYNCARAFHIEYAF